MESLREDWKRHGGVGGMFDPAIYAVRLYRFGRWAIDRNGPAKRIVVRAYRIVAGAFQLGFGVSIPAEARIGDAFRVIHGNGVRIHKNAVIGDRVTIMHEVTIGQSAGARGGAPRIGNDVFIGAGAKILGDVSVGDGAIIGACSLVVTDVPAHTTAVGVPARAMQAGTGQPRKPRDEHHHRS